MISPSKYSVEYALYYREENFSISNSNLNHAFICSNMNWKNRSSWPPYTDFCWPPYLLVNQQGEVVRLLRRRLLNVSGLSNRVVVSVKYSTINGNGFSHYPILICLMVRWKWLLRGKSWMKILPTFLSKILNCRCMTSSCWIRFRSE